eukprot:TRINITY_DN25180_c0_g1_i1.p1 TRINITY_DN25180_c0_g1~~TRINITY_DN25180_c0_g1_i1.p1  ORF type:complete len:513 (+),score=60.74 TRINITY_DN25180_c0_g1_i1:28-1566(+)
MFRFGTMRASRAVTSRLTSLKPGMQIIYGGDKVMTVTPEMAEEFKTGDSLLIVEKTGQPLIVPQAQRGIATSAVSQAAKAFGEMGGVSDENISKFYNSFASRLENDKIWGKIEAVNASDVATAKQQGRSTTRLSVSSKMRADMIKGLRGWLHAPSCRGKIVERVVHKDWAVDLVGAELGIVGFVFEGRPNVLADATGVLRGGNTVVYRIGSGALGTARAMMELAVDPSISEAGLPRGAVSLIDSTHHASGWALFADSRLSLAVARGSGPTVATLGSLAQQAGTPVSLHGTGGAWIIASEKANADEFKGAVKGSLDRKVCNTLNVCCIPQTEAARLVPLFLEGLEQAASKLQRPYKLHVVNGGESWVPKDLFSKNIAVFRNGEYHQEPQAELLCEEDLQHEWEWEENPEVTLKIVDSVSHAVDLFNVHSPQFIASVITSDSIEFEQFYNKVNAPFVGNGFTRWVDGQFALNKPELGLANWQHGRLLGRPGILTGDSVFTVRCRATQTVPNLAR